MANFKFVISHAGRSWQVEKDQKDCPIVGKKIGDPVSGEMLGLAGYELQLRGGSDKDGFPMRRDIESMGRKRIVVTRGKGFLSTIKGLRRRKTLRGNAVSADIVQVNCSVTKAGDTPLEQLLPSKKEEKAEKA